MDYASPALQLLGFLFSILTVVTGLIASVLFLREKGAGPRIMLAGASLSLVAIVPQAIYQLVNYYSYKGYEPPEVSAVMYYTVWNWLPGAAGFLFMAGLLLVTLQRRGLSRRISELESILSTRDSIEKK